MRATHCRSTNHVENNLAAKANVPKGSPWVSEGYLSDGRRDISSAAVMPRLPHVALARAVRNRIWSNRVEHHRPASPPASVADRIGPLLAIAAFGDARKPS